MTKQMVVHLIDAKTLKNTFFKCCKMTYLQNDIPEMTSVQRSQSPLHLDGHVLSLALWIQWVLNQMAVQSASSGQWNLLKDRTVDFERNCALKMIL